MTIEKNKTITLPVWLVSVIISLLATGFTTWGIVSASKATLELRATHNENNIKGLQDNKVERSEFNLVLNKLNSLESGQIRIETKLDKHIER